MISLTGVCYLKFSTLTVIKYVSVPLVNKATVFNFITLITLKQDYYGPKFRVIVNSLISI